MGTLNASVLLDGGDVLKGLEATGVSDTLDFRWALGDKDTVVHVVSVLGEFHVVVKSFEESPPLVV
jgi:hypothetical protein